MTRTRHHLTKNETIRLIRNDMVFQRKVKKTYYVFLRINNIAFPVSSDIKVRFEEAYLCIFCKGTLLATLWYYNITGLGYLYDSEKKIYKALNVNKEV